MELKSILKALLNTKKLTYKQVGELLGGITIQGVSARLNKPGSMSISTLLKYLDILGCELIIRNKSNNSDIWIITETKEEK